MTGLISSSSYSSRASIQTHFIALSNLLLRPEFIPYQYLNTISSILKSVSEMSDNVIFALSDEFHSAYFGIVSSFFTRVQYEYNVVLKTENFTDFLKTFSSYSQKINSLMAYSKVAWTSAEYYLTRISSKVDSSDPMLEFSTAVGTFKIEHKMASDVKANTYTVSSGLGYKVSFPSNLFDGTSVTDLNADVMMVSIVWFVNPLSIYPKDGFRPSSYSLSILIVNEYREVIPITGKTSTIELKIDRKRSNDA
jgi:hypothetical protein